MKILHKVTRAQMFQVILQTWMEELPSLVRKGTEIVNMLTRGFFGKPSRCGKVINEVAACQGDDSFDNCHVHPWP